MGRQPTSRDSSDSGTDSRPPDPIVPDTAENSIVSRRDPIERSESGLVSRDHQPRRGGPELIASWPLGTAPRQTAPGDVDWRVTDDEYVSLQRNLTLTNFLGPIEYSRIYAGVRGRGRVSEGGVLALRLRPVHLEGEEYETEIELVNSEKKPFATPMIEFTPDAPDYREHSFIGREMYGGYVLEARVEPGTGYLDQGTAVHLWSE